MTVKNTIKKQKTFTQKLIATVRNRLQELETGTIMATSAKQYGKAGNLKELYKINLYWYFLWKFDSELVAQLNVDSEYKRFCENVRANAL